MMINFKQNNNNYIANLGNSRKDKFGCNQIESMTKMINNHR